MDRKRLFALLKYLVSKLWSYDSRVPGLDALVGKPTKSTLLISLLVMKWVIGGKVCIMGNLDNAYSYSQIKQLYHTYGITMYIKSKYNDINCREELQCLLDARLVICGFSGFKFIVHY